MDLLKQKKTNMHRDKYVFQHDFSKILKRDDKEIDYIVWFCFC